MSSNDRSGGAKLPSLNVNEAVVREALARVEAPGVGRDVVAMDLVRNIRACGGAVALDLALPPAFPSRDELAAACRQAVAAIPGVLSANVRLVRAADGPGGGPMAGVRNVIAVGSGKGGVGKSTVAVNLAAALQTLGARVGVLDADIYGPSVPTMLGAHGRPLGREGRMIPLEAHGMQVASLGFLLEGQREAPIWRGPMVASAVKQLLESHWDDLDYLIVDLPPGTGDAPLTLCQSVPLSGAVVVLTAQEVALNIASKALTLFHRLSVPVLGLVENMGTFVCPCCGHASEIFASESEHTPADRLGVPLLGSVPLDPRMVRAGDAGVPIVLSEPDSPQAAAFRAIAEAVAARCALLKVSSADREAATGQLVQLGL
jgi:ATP-binding protein involved in chromosome partitioning